ncbi:MAG: lysophospholipid acyltransferase family protein [Planctomycetota bacterium]
MHASIRWDEPRLRRWGRRAVTIPLYFFLFWLSLVALPVILIVTAAIDAFRGSRWALSRCALFFVFYLGCEVLGIAVAAGLWVGRLTIDRNRYLTLNFRVECWWARTLFGGGQRLFGLRLDVKGLDQVETGPILLFMRHASVGDTVLPAVLVSSQQGIRLRYVMKRELLWDPCLDIVGNRLPNYFVRRGSGDAAREVAAVRRLAEDLAPDEGIFIDPEGTRFSPERQRRALDRIRRQGDVDLLAHAERLRHVLPPRLGGTLALLDADTGADVVFCVHFGFDGIRSFQDFLWGGLIDRTIEVEFWRVPAQSIPSDRNAQARWLYDQWSRVDEWVGNRSEAAAGAALSQNAVLPG